MALMICGEEYSDYALKHYLAQGVCKEEFNLDLHRISLINLSLKRFEPGKSPRTLVNQLIVVFNTFETEAAVNMVYAKTEPDMYPRLKAALLTFGVWRNEISESLFEPDHELMMALNNDLEDWRK